MTDEDRVRLGQLGHLAEAVKAESPAAALQLSDRLAGLLGNQPDREQAVRMRELGSLLVRLGGDYLNRAEQLDVVVQPAFSGKRGHNYDQARRRALAALDNALDHGGMSWSRDELYDR